MVSFATRATLPKSWLISIEWLPIAGNKSRLQGLGKIPPAGTNFNKQPRPILNRIGPSLRGEWKPRSQSCLPLLPGRHFGHAASDSRKSRSRISPRRCVPLIRQAKAFNCVPFLNLRANSGHHLPQGSPYGCVSCVLLARGNAKYILSLWPSRAH